MTKINVMSCFDGMSCGQIALNRVGIEYDNYFASEIDKNAIKVTQSNYPNTIQLGDITQIKGSDLPKINLLFGGSPCQGFSFEGKQLNFNDPRSKLFFEFVRLKDELKPEYFLLENVVMTKHHQNVISRYLNVDPIKINSSLVSAQSRNRLYWTNIPNITQPEDRKLLFKDIIDNKTDEYVNWTDVRMKNYYDKIYVRNDQYKVFALDEKIGCLMAQMGGSEHKIWDHTKENIFRLLTRNEWERLQTVPDNYTSAVSTRNAKKMLGNGWTVDVIAHIFQSLKDILDGTNKEKVYKAKRLF